MQNTEESLDLGASLARHYSNYLQMFNVLMEKFKQKDVVTKVEIDRIRELYEKYLTARATAEVAEVLDEAQKKFFERHTPSLEPILQCYDIQQLSDMQQDDLQDNTSEAEGVDAEEAEAEDGSNESFDSNGSDTLLEYRARLVEKIESLFRENPIKNIDKMLELYEKYQVPIEPSVSTESEDNSNSLVNARLEDGIAQYLFLESRRKIMTRELLSKISYYDCKVKRPPSDKVDLEKLMKSLEEFEYEYEYYMTTEQLSSLDRIRGEVLYRRFNQMQQSNTRTDGIALGSPFPTPHSLMVSPYSSQAPANGSASQKDEEDATVDDLSPLKGLELFSRAESPDIVGEIHPSSPNKPASPSKRGVTFATDPEVHDTSSRGTLKKTIAQPRRPSISPSLWLLIGATSASLVAGIVLLALASSLSSTIALAGFACVGAGLLGACTLTLFTPKVSQKKAGMFESAPLFNAGRN